MSVLIFGAWFVLGGLIDGELLKDAVEPVGLLDVRLYIGGVIYWTVVNSLLEEYVFRWFSGEIKSWLVQELQQFFFCIHIRNPSYLCSVVFRFSLVGKSIGQCQFIHRRCYIFLVIHPLSQCLDALHRLTLYVTLRCLVLEQ